MANKKTTDTATNPEVATATPEPTQAPSKMAAGDSLEESINLDKNVTITSLAGWNTSFPRLTSVGDVLVPPYGSTRLSTSEVIAQVQSNRPLFTGTDGAGSHATYYINDEQLRRYLGFDAPDGTASQKYLTEKLVKKLFEAKSQRAFEESFAELVKTRAEKKYVIRCIENLKINDFSKIRFAESYTGFKVG